MTPSASGGAPARRSRGLLGSSALISAGVAVSRVTGLARTMVLVAALGTTALADAYNFANNVPNLLYELVAGGVLSAVLLPQFVDQLERRDRAATSAVVSVSVVGLAVLAVVGVVVAPVIAWAVAGLNGGAGRADQQAALTILLRWLLPQVFFYGVMTVVTALLQARRRFGAAAFAPALNNLVTIAAYVIAARLAPVDLHDERVPLAAALDDRWVLTVLGVGTTLGVVANALVLLPALRRERIGLRPRLQFGHPAISQLARSARGALGFVAVAQVTVVVTTVLAKRYSPTGGFSAYTYANLFFYVAFGLLAVSVMTALAPELAAAAQAGDLRTVRREWLRGLRLIVLLVAPAAAGLIALARPLMGSLPLGDVGADLTAGVLAWFAFGLTAFAVFQYVVRSFYALSDTRTPLRLAVVQNGLVLALGAIAAPLAGLRGLAAAYGVAFVVSGVVAFASFAHRVGRVPLGQVRPVAGMLAAAVAMALVSAAAVALAGWGDRSVADPVQVAIGVVVGVVTYPAYLWVFRADGDLRAAAGLARRAVGR